MYWFWQGIFSISGIRLPVDEVLEMGFGELPTGAIVPGNHEYYNYSDVMERGLQWRWMFRKNVGYYQNQVVCIDDTDFVLSTLWSRINPNDEYFV